MPTAIPGTCPECDTGWDWPEHPCAGCGNDMPPPCPIRITCPWCGAPDSYTWPDDPCLSCGTTKPPWRDPPEHDWLAPVIPLPSQPATTADAYLGFLRSVLLTAAAALAQASTPDDARALLLRWEGPEGIRAAAAELLDTLSGASDHH